jgi:hypothetical protein
LEAVFASCVVVVVLLLAVGCDAVGDGSAKKPEVVPFMYVLHYKLLQIHEPQHTYRVDVSE